MRYLFLAYTNEEAFANLSAADRDATVQMFVAFVKDVEQRGIRELNARPQPSTTAKTVRTRDGKLEQANGPYAATKEQITGVYILNCEDLDEAIQYAGKIPASRFGVVEVRPLVDV